MVPPRPMNRRSILASAAMIGGAALTTGCGAQSVPSDTEGDQTAMTDASEREPDPRLAEYEMPMEDRLHERTFMQWPVLVDVYGDRDLRRTQGTIADIANAIARFEPVVMLASEADAVTARPLLHEGVEIWDIPTNDLWCRDSGPTFVRNEAGGLAVAHIHFNGWGGKQVHDRDGRVAAAVAERLGLPLLETGLVGEQGGIEHDGAGTLMAHASCWVNPDRSRQNADQIGRKLMTALGGDSMIWAPGLVGHDITDYHIDALARFVGPGRVLIQMPERLDRSDPYSVTAWRTHDILRQATDSRGRPLELIVMPEPIDIRSRQPDFVASYVNYYVCNGAVIAGQFGDSRADDRARGMLTDLYPGREVVLLNIDPLGESGGGIHCATQQQPQA